VTERLELTGESYDSFDYANGALDGLLATLERAASLTPEQEELASRITIESVMRSIEHLTQLAGRKRAVLLLDDAALTLTPEYMVEFFDVVRVLKSKLIAPKCSVYPGTTEYGPRFHARQEAREVHVWISIEHERYLEMMLEIGNTRAKTLQNALPEALQKQLALAAFGIPRAYLTLLRGMDELGGASQANTNRVIQRHRDGILAEYRSLAEKIPKFATLISTGEVLFTKMIEAVRDANARLDDEKQLLIGIEKTDFSQLSARMAKFLIEAGLLYEVADVSHGGPERIYRRFIPHLSALMAIRAFAVGKRGQASANVVDFLARKSTKHPVRRTLETLLGKELLSGLSIDLPTCQQCGEPRMNETQKFCHNCGSQLVDGSNFTRLMKLEFEKVPGLTDFQRQSLEELHLEKIGDLVAMEDPGTELRKVHNVGQKRSERIIYVTQSYIDEFLS